MCVCVCVCVKGWRCRPPFWPPAGGEPAPQLLQGAQPPPAQQPQEPTWGSSKTTDPPRLGMGASAASRGAPPLRSGHLLLSSPSARILLHGF